MPATVIVVGGGVGGLSLALALARRGMASTLVEQAPRIEPIGAGIQISPNASRILFALGLEAAIRAVGVAPERAEVHDAATGRRLVVNRLGAEAERRWRAPYLTLTRAALQAVLLDAVQASGLVELRLGQAATRVAAGTVRLADGDTLDAEVIVGCDGLHSVVHGSLGKASPPRFTGQTAWRGLAAMATPGPPAVQVWTGPARHFVRYSVAPGLVNMVAVTAARSDDREGWDAEGEGDRLAAAFTDWPEEVRATIAAVKRPRRTVLYDRPPLSRWSDGATTLLGDAAHPMLPFLAQGAAMAIEDAWVLGRLLAEAPEPKAALKAYEEARRARTAKAQGWATRNATLFHLQPALAGGLFGAVSLADRVLGRDSEARFDWLYGWRG